MRMTIHGTALHVTIMQHYIYSSAISLITAGPVATTTIIIDHNNNNYLWLTNNILTCVMISVTPLITAAAVAAVYVT